MALGASAFFGNKKSNPAITQPITTNAVPAKSNNPIATVTLTNSGFTPKDITVKVGTKVTWENKSGAAGTVNSDNHPTHLLYPFLNLEEFDDSSSMQVAFEKTGRYSYHNHLDPSQTGTVTVE